MLKIFIKSNTNAFLFFNINKSKAIECTSNFSNSFRFQSAIAQNQNSSVSALFRCSENNPVC